jgi:hypothetical protein
MSIRHIGMSIIHTPNCDLHLNNVLHVSKAKKKLVTIDCLALDNNVFLVFHHDFFLLKDQDMRSTLLREDCQKWIYPHL